METALRKWGAGELDCDSLRAVFKSNREHAFDYQVFYESCHKQQSISPALFRLLRDVTTSTEAQRFAVSSGCLLRALQVLENANGTKEIKTVALMFVSNCLVATGAQEERFHAEARQLVWNKFDFPTFAQINPSAASFILYQLTVLDVKVALIRRREMVKDVWVQCLLDMHTNEQCAYWVLIQVANTYFDAPLIVNREHSIVNAIDENEPHFPLEFALHVLPKQLDAAMSTSDNNNQPSIGGGVDNDLLVKLAIWASEYPISNVNMAKRVLQLCAERIAKLQPATTQCLQIIANVLTRGDAVLKDFVREIGMIQSILLLTRTINPKYPTLREWALFAFRACCEGNIETQKFVYSLQNQQ